MHRVDPYFKKLDSEACEKSSAASPLRFEQSDPFLRTAPYVRKERVMRANSTGSPIQSSRTSVFRSRVPSAKFPKSATPDKQAPTPQGFFTVEANVMEPLRMLHRCICYFSSHPEIYGTNIGGLLEREYLYVMRVKASETALLLPTPVPVSDVALPPISATKPMRQESPSKDRERQQNRYAGLVASPGNIEDALSPGQIASTPSGIFGYGGTSFVQANAGFLSLVDKACRQISLQDESVCQGQHQIPTPTQVTASGPSIRESPFSSNELNAFSAFVTPSDGVQCSNPEQQGIQPPSDEALLENAGIRGQVSAPPPQLLIDGPGYEVCFLRNQLQQVEAAYNSKCIGLHELRLEHNRNLIELNAAKKKIQGQSVKINEMRMHSDTMKRELDVWKQRASEFDVHTNTSNTNASAEASRNLQAVQLKDSRREHTNLMRLWRETEKSLQETKRSLESSEKETALSQNYLTDAFYLVERLERRVSRRDDFIEVQRRRQRSLEEKYEKVVWCFQELETLRGGHSYADFLLSEDPIWSLFLFVRLQRHMNGYSLIDESTSSPTFTKEPLPFCRTLTGGKFMDAYSPSLIQAHVMNEVSPGRTRYESFRGNSSVSLGCHLLRWRGNFSINYLTNYPSAGADHSGVQRRSQPLLTLASILLPPTQAPAFAPLATGTGSQSPTGGAEPAASPAPVSETSVQNSQQYSQATLRLLLYCFWNNRLAQYQRQMERRVEAMPEGSPEGRDRDGVDEMQLFDEGITPVSTNVESPRSRIPTFLSALVGFLQRLFSTSSGATKFRETLTSLRDTIGLSRTSPLSEDEKAPYVLVRGVINRSASESGKEGGTGGAASQDGCRVFNTLLYTTRAEDGAEVPLVLAPQVRELLYALYYYAEEYKGSDADFLLFYLVAHQQLPELVAINFYASMEALRYACDETLCRHLGAQSQAVPKSQVTADSVSQAGDGVLSQQSEFLNDTPLSAIHQAVKAIDDAPLVDQDVDLEPDSDGEGFGVILPGQTTGVNGDSKTPTTEQPAVNSSPVARKPSASLKHNIYAYLFPEAAESDRVKAAENSVKVSTAEAGKCLPSAWVKLDETLGTVLGSHASLLAAFKEAKSASDTKLAEIQLRKRRQFASQSHSLSAARGLLPFEEVMALLKTHCFSSYALSCCGTPRFSLFETLCPNKDAAEALSPFTRIGQLPPTELHMRRLRFAVALDQPSTLIHHPNLFAVDPKHGTASHFHDEYLRLTIDLYLAQQEAWMNVVRSACLTRHEGSAGIEYCDGDVYFPFIRGAVDEQFRSLRLGALQSQLYAKHFTDYSEILRQDDSVRFEQFVDAPFFINVPSLPEEYSNRNRSRELEKCGTIEDEGTVCALHHLALAVRMTYVVWGLDAHPSAHLAVRLLPHTTRWHSRLARSLSVARTSDTGEIDMTVTEEPVATTRMEDFIVEVKREYMDAVRRVNTGVEQQNTLRRVASRLNSVSPNTVKSNDGTDSAVVSPRRTPTFLENVPGDHVIKAVPSEDTILGVIIPALGSEHDKSSEGEHGISGKESPTSRSLAHMAQADVHRLYTTITTKARQPPQASKRSASSKKNRPSPEDLLDYPASAANASRLALPAVHTLARYLGIRHASPPRTKRAARKAGKSARAPQDLQAALNSPCHDGCLTLFAQQARFAREAGDAVEAAEGGAAAPEAEAPSSGASTEQPPEDGEEGPQGTEGGEAVSGALDITPEIAAVLKVRLNCAALSLM